MVECLLFTGAGALAGVGAGTGAGEKNRLRNTDYPAVVVVWWYTVDSS